MLDSGPCLAVERGKVVFLAAPALLVSAVTEVIRTLTKFASWAKDMLPGEAIFQVPFLFWFCLFRRVRNCSVLLLQNASSCSRDMPEVNEATLSAPFRFH
ncbi:MAG: hypothetical protein D3914_03865 [Candidatus Electrothrix sp. LOE2]|nr:hypothetical protein [Candidatus Electrothrix sp. LOE2]